MKQIIGCLLWSVASISLAANTVVVKPLSELLIVSAQSAPAEVINEDHATISARLTARVDQVLVNVGDLVENAQPLARLECRDYELAKQQAQSALKSLQAQTRLARQQLSRAERLLKQKNASMELRDQRRAELATLLAEETGAKVGLSSAELAIERCVVKAPFSGSITDRMVSTGSLVAPGSPLFKLLNLNSGEVSAQLTSSQLASLRTASRVDYQTGGRSFSVNLRAVIPFVDDRASTQQVRFVFSGDDALSGSSGRIVWLDAQRRLPVQYVVSRNGELGVMQVTGEKARFVRLPNAVEGQAAYVNVQGHDLKGDSQIVIEGQHGIEDGQDVVIDW